MTQQPPAGDSPCGEQAADDAGSSTARAGRPGSPRDGLDRFCARVRATRLRRRLSDRWLAGVCGGVADAIGVDPVIVRIALGLLVVMGGIGVPAYFVAFCLMADTEDKIPLELALRDGDRDSVVLLLFTGLLVANTVSDLAPATGQGVRDVLHMTSLAIVACAAWWWWQHRTSGGASTVAGSTPPPSAASTDSSSASSGSTSAAAPTESLSALTWPPAASTSTASGARESSAPSSAGAPYVPVRRRRQTLGLPGALATIGLVAAGAGAVVLAQRDGYMSTPHPVPVALAVALALASGFLLVVGLAGRRGGFTVPVVMALLIATVATGGVTSTIRDGRVGGTGWSWTWWGEGADLGDHRWTPASIVDGQTFETGMGSGTLDLTRLDRDHLGGTAIEAKVGMGDMTVLVPEGLTLDVDGHVGLGDLVVEHADGRRESINDGSSVVGSGSPALTLDAHVGMGEMTIKEVAR